MTAVNLLSHCVLSSIGCSVTHTEFYITLLLTLLHNRHSTTAFYLVVWVIFHETPDHGTLESHWIKINVNHVEYRRCSAGLQTEPGFPQREAAAETQDPLDRHTASTRSHKPPPTAATQTELSVTLQTFKKNTFDKINH